MSPNEPKPATPEAQALLRAAGGDSKTVGLLLQHRDAPVSSVCFHAQQGVKIAEDPFRQDTARHHAQHRRRGGLQGPLYD